MKKFIATLMISTMAMVTDCGRSTTDTSVNDTEVVNKSINEEEFDHVE